MPFFRVDVYQTVEEEFYVEAADQGEAERIVERDGSDYLWCNVSNPEFYVRGPVESVPSGAEVVNADGDWTMG